MTSAVAFVILLTAGYLIRSHTGHAPAGRSARPLPTQGAAADLTAIQLGHRPGPENAMLRRIDSLLELLEADCPANTRPRLAALTVDSIRKLRRDGISVRPNGVLGGVVGSTHIGATADCTVFFTRYVERERRLSA